MTGRKSVVVVLLVAFMVFLLAGCAPPEKPTRDGPGPLSIRFEPEVVAPEYHNPLEWWQRVHFRSINNGEMPEGDCTYCHNTQTSCDNCHNYVGVKR
ncbi:MAG: hypothetical protein ACUVXG_01230 [Anaerolineae bacterium]